MRIEEFSIRRYGPLPDSGRVVLGNFTLFFGNNEDGKTLTIDALVRFLFGKKARVFEDVDRVEEEPEGYVIVKDDKGETHKFPEKGDFTAITGISPTEARNIFIIRDSDLSISRESEHYRNVTDKLTGLRTEKIERIKSSLLELGKLTPSGDFRDVKDEKLKTRINEARTLLEDIRKLRKEAIKSNFDGLEKSLFEIEENFKQVEYRLKLFEQAKNRETYEKGKRSLEVLKELMEELKKLRLFSLDEERAWIRYEQDLFREKERKGRLLEEIKKKQKELEELMSKFKEEKQKFDLLERIKKKIDDELKPDLKSYEIKEAELEEKKAKSAFFSSASLISALLLMVSMIGLMVNKTEKIFLYLLIIFAFLGAVFGFQKYILFREKSGMKGLLRRIRFNKAKYDLKGESIEEILQSIQKFDENHYLMKNVVDSLEKEIEVKKSEIENLSQREMPELESKIRNSESEIDRIKRRVNVENLSDYRNKLKELQEKENLFGRQIEVLSTLFGKKGENLGELISSWHAEIENLKIYKDKAEGVSYSKQEEEKLKEIKAYLLEMRESVEKQISDFLLRLEEVERRANSLFKIESDYIHCKTSVDLKAVEEKVERFIQSAEKVRELVLFSGEIFDKIKLEEEEKISRLFGKESPISRYFSRITEGFYSEVIFNVEEKKLFVRRHDGLILDVKKLSGGAWDQLYFSIRLGIAESLLAGGTAFFILDDPFIKADRKRLEKQIRILRKISESGWQIIYVTAKDEVREVLKDEIESRKIDYRQFS